MKMDGFIRFISSCINSKTKLFNCFSSVKCCLASWWDPFGRMENSICTCQSRCRHLPQSWEQLQWRGNSERMRRLEENPRQDTHSGSLGKSGVYSYRNTWTKILQISSIKLPTSILLSRSTEITHSEGATYPERVSGRLKSDIFLWCCTSARCDYR